MIMAAGLPMPYAYGPASSADAMARHHGDREPTGLQMWQSRFSFLPQRVFGQEPTVQLCVGELRLER